MAYTALYRKLRPQNFSQVIGQKNIVKTLKNQFLANKITHCYLFCGIRGTGKTSTAKIFAKLLNCESPIEGEPCGVCKQCIDFSENRSINIFEIDAASNNSVEDIRNLREELKYPPTNGKYKVYIIDEVHMLSIGAFNALLKTLEEPPYYVIFILATTDYQKIPQTIISRCQRFDFKRITLSEMFLAIKESIKEENIQIEDEALKYIAYISDGAMRDALSILEQCSSFYFGQKITLDNVLEVLGATKDSVFFDITDALINFDNIKCINIIDELIMNGRDISQFLYDLINHFRNLIIAKVSEKNIIDISEEKYKKLKELANDIEHDYIIKLIGTFSEALTQIKHFASNARIILEIACIKLCNATAEQDITDIKQKLKLLEKNINNSPKEIVYKQEIQEDTKQQETKQEVKLRELAIAEDFEIVIKNWAKVCEKFEQTLSEYLKKAKPKNLEDEFLYIVSKIDFEKNRIDENKEKIQNVLEEMFNKKYNIKSILEEEFLSKFKKIASSSPKEDKGSIENQVKNLLPTDTLNIE